MRPAQKIRRVRDHGLSRRQVERRRAQDRQRERLVKEYMRKMQA